jgi:hypothetical protein
MLTWDELAAARPDLTSAGRDLLYQFGVGLGFLATVRPDGAPRLHPVCPLIGGSGLQVFVIPSPKQADLRRDGRYTLRSFPPPGNEDGFCLSGRAVGVSEPDRRDALADQFVSERAALGVPRPGDGDALFELLIDRCLLTLTAGHGDPAPDHRIWAAP